MNNIRKIIADKIAELKDKRVTDYADGFNDGLFEAFKIFLEEIPAHRTEADILNDFEKLGYEVLCNTNYIRFTNYDKGIEIRIKFDTKTYCKFDRDLCELPYEDLTIQEHKLLNELFEVWQWV